MSQLVKVPPGEEVSTFARSGLYVPEGVNLFARYFETILPTDDAALRRDLPFDDVAHPHNTQLGRDPNRVVNLRKLRDRFFRLKPEWVNKARAVIGNQKTLGVHYRGTDKYTEVPRISRDKVLSTILQITKHQSIFLATDEQSAAAWFQTYIPAIKLNAHQRTDDARGLHITEGSLQLADEAMLDICCLAACDSLLVGRGNFSDWAIILGETQAVYYVDDGGE